MVCMAVAGELVACAQIAGGQQSREAQFVEESFVGRTAAGEDVDRLRARHPMSRASMQPRDERRNGDRLGQRA